MNPGAADDEEDEGGVGPAVVGSAAIGLLIATALLIGAVPYLAALVGVAQLPYVGELRPLSVGELILRASAAFAIFALAEIPTDVAGKAVTIWMNLGTHNGQRDRARVAGKGTALLLRGALLALLVGLWVTATATGAILIALVTVALEAVLEPFVDRYIKK